MVMLASSKAVYVEDNVHGWDWDNGPAAELHLEDGTKIRIASQYEEPWSEVTPGQGLMPPTFWVWASP